MKGFHKNCRRIENEENEVFILYMPDHELVTASNLQKNPNCFELSVFRRQVILDLFFNYLDFWISREISKLIENSFLNYI